MYLSSMRINASKGLVIYDHFVHNDFRCIVRLSANHNVFSIIFLLYEYYVLSRDLLFTI